MLYRDLTCLLKISQRVKLEFRFAVLGAGALFIVMVTARLHKAASSECEQSIPPPPPPLFLQEFLDVHLRAVLPRLPNLLAPGIRDSGKSVPSHKKGLDGLGSVRFAKRLVRC